MFLIYSFVNVTDELKSFDKFGYNEDSKGPRMGNTSIQPLIETTVLIIGGLHACLDIYVASTKSKMILTCTLLYSEMKFFEGQAHPWDVAVLEF